MPYMWMKLKQASHYRDLSTLECVACSYNVVKHNRIVRLYDDNVVRYGWNIIHQDKE